MMLFSLLAGLLVAGALLFVLPPLWTRRGEPALRDPRSLTLSVYQNEAAELRRDLESGALAPEQYDEARRELEQRLAEEMPGLGSVQSTDRHERWVTWAVMAVLPLGAVAVYLLTGNPGAIRLSSPAAEVPAPGHPLSQADILGMIARLNARLANAPDDPAGWAMLGRSYTVLGRYGDALQAFGKSVELDDSDPDVLIDYADVLAATRGKDLAGMPLEMILKALAINPNHPKALALAGTAAFNAKQYAQAVEYWERLLPLLQPGSQGAQGVARSIAEAKALAAGGQPAAQAPASVASVSGRVVLSPQLAALVRPEDTLFVFARAAQGPPIPLAILRRQAKDLPLEFTLDDSMAMAPEMKLSAFPQVMVGARISRTGQAMPAKGDLQGMVGPLPVGTRGVELNIDGVVP